MSIAQSFEAAIMKAVRGAEISLDTLNAHSQSNEPVLQRLSQQDDHRLFTVFEAIKSGIPIDEIFELTRIDRWFLYKLKNLADYENELQQVNSGGKDDEKSAFLSPELYLRGKKLGYTDAAIERLSGKKIDNSRKAVYKMVDTCGAEFDAKTPYFYSTYDEYCEARSFRARESRSSSSSAPAQSASARASTSTILRPLRLDAKGIRLRRRHHKQQPGDGLDGLRHRGQALLRAAHAGGRHEHHRC